MDWHHRTRWKGAWNGFLLPGTRIRGRLSPKFDSKDAPHASPTTPKPIFQLLCNRCELPSKLLPTLSTSKLQQTRGAGPKLRARVVQLLYPLPPPPCRHCCQWGTGREKEREKKKEGEKGGGLNVSDVGTSCHRRHRRHSPSSSAVY